MDFLSWLSLAGICALGAMSPGPSLLIVLRCASAGVRQGFACALAHGFGVAIYAGLTAFGLAVLIIHSPLLFNILQWAGAAMLIYLGWKALRAPAPNTESESSPTQALSVGRAAIQGFGITFFNPKIAIFFTALFSQFVAEQQTFAIKLGMVSLAAGIDAGWYCLVTLIAIAGRNRGWVRSTAGHRMQQLFGALLIALAAKLVFSI